MKWLFVLFLLVHTSTTLSNCIDTDLQTFFNNSTLPTFDEYCNGPYPIELPDVMCEPYLNALKGDVRPGVPHLDASNHSLVGSQYNPNRCK